MKFSLIDEVLEIEAERIVAQKRVDPAEEYLQDHFPDFPVLPGVMMIESMVQAAQRLVAQHSKEPVVLGFVRGVKYGSFVRAGETLRVEIELRKSLEDGGFEMRGEGRVLREGDSDRPVSVTGRFTLRPTRIHSPEGVA